MVAIPARGLSKQLTSTLFWGAKGPSLLQRVERNRSNQPRLTVSLRTEPRSGCGDSPGTPGEIVPSEQPPSRKGLEECVLSQELFYWACPRLCWPCRTHLLTISQLLQELRSRVGSEGTAGLSCSRGEGPACLLACHLCPRGSAYETHTDHTIPRASLLSTRARQAGIHSSRAEAIPLGLAISAGGAFHSFLPVEAGFIMHSVIISQALGPRRAF